MKIVVRIMPDDPLIKPTHHDGAWMGEYETFATALEYAVVFMVKRGLCKCIEVQKAGDDWLIGDGPLAQVHGEDANHIRLCLSIDREED